MPTKTADNPLGLPEPVHNELKARAEARRRAEHEQEVRARGCGATTADVLAEIDPAAHAALELRRRKIEVVRTVRAVAIAGHRYEAGEMLVIWPRNPAPGYVADAALANLPPGSFTRDAAAGTVTFHDDCRVAGQNFREGQTVDSWPTEPPRGMIAPRVAVELLEAGTLEPVELEPATVGA